MERAFQRSFKPVTITPPDTHKVPKYIWGRKINPKVPAAEVFLAQWFLNFTNTQNP